MNNNLIDFEVSDDAFSQGISPEGLKHAKIGLKSDFYPWHKPRKHWVRVNQWNSSISRLIKTLKLDATTRSLSYLSLPGPDLLDIRAIQPICASVNVKLRFIGLNNIGNHEKEVQIEQALSIDEVHALSHIDAGSLVVLDKFEHIANENSVAYGRIIKDKASFDVVNIDLCCSFAETKPDESIPDYYNALYRLLRHQADTRPDDWLFFLTTRNNQDMVHPDAIGKLIESINNIIINDVEFKPLLIRRNIFQENNFVNDLIDTTQLDSRSFANSFLLGVGNWIVRALLDSSPKWKVSTLPVFGYHVAEQSSDCDMISLGFYCSRVPEPAIDTQGLAGVSLHSNVQTFQQIAKGAVEKLISRIEGQTDIDVKLCKDNLLYQKSLDESATLLRAARYHEDVYREWAERENQKLSKFLTTCGLI